MGVAASDHAIANVRAASRRGRERVRLFAQVCPSGADFYSATAGCRSADVNSWTDTGLARTAQNVELGALQRYTLYHWRARLAFAPPTAHLTGIAAAPRHYGPWMYFRAEGDSGDVRIVPLASDTLFADGFE